MMKEDLPSSFSLINKKNGCSKYKNIAITFLSFSYQNCQVKNKNLQEKGQYHINVCMYKYVWKCFALKIQDVKIKKPLKQFHSK